jgi:hypothetical protein
MQKIGVDEQGSYKGPIFSRKQVLGAKSQPVSISSSQGIEGEEDAEEYEDV